MPRGFVYLFNEVKSTIWEYVASFPFSSAILGTGSSWWVLLKIGDPLEERTLPENFVPPPSTINCLERMRPSPLWRQIATGASTQTKLPLPPLYPAGSVPRLKPPQANFLPSLINCPTTLPPVLTITEVDKSKPWDVAKTIYYKAKSFYTFYKTGIKQFNSNRKIRKFLKNELMKSFNHIKIPGTANIVMSRSEFQMCIRTRRDWRKIPCTSYLSAYVDDSIWSCCVNFWRIYTYYRMGFWNVVRSWNMYYTGSIG